MRLIRLAPPVTIAVDSYGPVTDNAQSVFELSVISRAGVPDGVVDRFTGAEHAVGRAGATRRTFF